MKSTQTEPFKSESTKPDTSDIQIIEVSDNRDLSRFINFPKGLYLSDKNFVFEPIGLQKEFFSLKNPFFRHSSAKYFIAVSDGKVLGRVASILNTVHNKTYQENTGFFGFFECIENYDVAGLLLDSVVKSHKNNGFNKVIGPTNFTTNDSCGMLIEGFDRPPVVMMPYNKPYYNDFLRRYGFEKETDLSSYYIDDSILGSGSFEKLAQRIGRKLSGQGISVRNIDYKRLDEELIPFCEVYNQSNRSNYGFIPLTEEEFLHTGRQFRAFVPENLMLLAERADEKIGFISALPDLNQCFSHIRSGKLFPTGFLKYLWYKRKINNSRILILGVKEAYRNMGIDILLYKTIQENLALNGILKGEACYVMEDNLMMHSILKKIGGRKIKEYRIYKLSCS
jgi:ribosomal protein S18 acetylase RimI-like enzyme